MIKLVTPHNLPDQRFIIKC